MRKTKLLMIIGALIGVAMLATACSAYDPIESVEGQGYTLVVSYDISAKDATEQNFPTFNGAKELTLTHRYALAEGQTSTFVAEPGTGALGEVSKPLYAGHFLEGWYRDPDFTQKWDFATDRASESLKLYARWFENFAFEIRYYEDGKEGVADTIVVNEGGVLTKQTSIKRENHTLVALWQNRECTVPWDYKTTHTGTLADGVQTDRLNTVWSTWIKGNYKLVYEPEDLRSISDGQNYMLMKDLDFTGKGSLWNACYVDYYGEFNGNGHTIRNLSFSADYNKSVSRMGLFGSLTSHRDSQGTTVYAKLVDVTFENVTMNMSYNGDYRATMGLLAGVIDAGVTFENVRITGAIDATQMETIPSRNFYLGKLAGRLDVGTGGVAEGLVGSIDVLTDPTKFSVNMIDQNDFELVKVG